MIYSMLTALTRMELNEQAILVLLPLLMSCIATPVDVCLGYVIGRLKGGAHESLVVRLKQTGMFPISNVLGEEPVFYASISG